MVNIKDESFDKHYKILQVLSIVQKHLENPLYKSNPQQEGSVYIFDEKVINHAHKTIEEAMKYIAELYDRKGES